MVPPPPLAISLAGLERRDDAPWAAGPRAAIDWAAAAGFGAVQLDATAPGLRPRELDRSARRDLGALLRRAGLSLAGLGLWIPLEHLTDASRAERALEAILQAVELAADLARLGAGQPGPAISCVLPKGIPADIVAQLADAAGRTGVRIADHAVPLTSAAEVSATNGGLDLGIDPAAILLAGLDPAVAAARAGPRLASARWSDASLTGRIAPGSESGRLDLTAYLVSLTVAGYSRAVILDLRGIHDQASAAPDCLARW